MSKLITQDGNCIVIDPDVGEVSARTYEECMAEIRKRKAYRNIRPLRGTAEGSPVIITKHREIQGSRA